MRAFDSFEDLTAARWTAVAGQSHPFTSYPFLSALERSGSVGAGTGWQALPLAVDGPLATDGGVAPLWGKSHSRGEYVFDQAWAEAWMRAGGAYYPKLVIAVPFTPVPGPRLLGEDSAARALIRATEGLVTENDLSSAHALFLDPRDRALFAQAGWLLREGVQFHWHNPGYRDFTDFLEGLTARKRKAIRRERAEATAGISVRMLRGAEIHERDWDAFWIFYQHTGARKWGTPYLTRPFFSMIAEAIPDSILLVLAERAGQPVAGALHFIGADRLYGRYWGATEPVPFLHFELCYYRAMDFAIAHGLSWVEAGAQGEHKLARGYAPMPTWSAHFLANPRFRAAVADFLTQESAALAMHRADLAAALPFRMAGPNE